MKILFYLSIFLFFSASFVSATCDTDLTLSTNHLQDNGDGTILDSKTGLVWKKCLQGFTGTNCISQDLKTTFTWAEALNQTDNTWRLPNAKELQSIVEEACLNPSINIEFFPGTYSTGVWSNSPVLSGTFSGQSLYVAFHEYGNVLPAERTETYHVRLVRNAPAE
ncbi:MAG: DUF1566 domain-containing protein [Candidatus Electrothrix sp. LOE1_4_5]|nr:DUF1566 domain-containing protein [Candidatus Electrothrix gigas]